MRLYICRGLEGWKVPRDVTHVMAGDSVTIIKMVAFQRCKNLVSVIMNDELKRINILSSSMASAGGRRGITWIEGREIWSGMVKMNSGNQSCLPSTWQEVKAKHRINLFPCRWHFCGS
eukprot:182547_1